MPLRTAEALFRRGDHAASRQLVAKVMKTGQSLAAGNRLLGFMAGKEGNFAEAMELLRTSLKYDPDSLEAWYFLGVAALREEQHRAAISAFQQLLKRQAGVFEAHHDLGLALLATGNNTEALKHLEHACRLRPDSFEAHVNKGAALGKLGHHADEVKAYERALVLKPKHATVIENYGNALCQAGRFSEAAALYERTLNESSNRAEFAFALGGLCYTKLQMADWTGLEQLTAQLRARILSGDACVEPFALFLLPSTSHEQLQVARRYAAALYPLSARAMHRRERTEGQRLRVGYLSADFGRHATSYLVAELLERHERARFEVTAFALTGDDGSAMRHRLTQSVEHFVEIHGLSDVEAAQKIADLQIDVLLDLGGYTRNARPGILALRPAPLQISYLCYPGTTGAPFMDYLVADETVIPEEDLEAFSEKIIYLPNSYQPHDTRRAVAAEVPSRASLGLPENGFVFCSFNSAPKLNASSFAIWMRLLIQVPGSVLWLKADSSVFQANLKLRAQEHGVEASRLVFAQWASQDLHIARIALADLCLDNLPYNAHTTASDALWAGVPLITCQGQTFAGRVASSLLRAAGLPELITTTLAEYEDLALALATDRSRLAALREKVAQARRVSALFNTQAYTLHLERAYLEVWQRHCAGLAPDHIRVSRSLAAHGSP